MCNEHRALGQSRKAEDIEFKLIHNLFVPHLLAEYLMCTFHDPVNFLSEARKKMSYTRKTSKHASERKL